MDYDMAMRHIQNHSQCHFEWKPINRDKGAQSVCEADLVLDNDGIFQSYKFVSTCVGSFIPVVHNGSFTPEMHLLPGLPQINRLILQ